MPEGDAVRRTALRLDRALAGRTLMRSDLRVSQSATLDLAGATVLGTATHGKHLLTRLHHDDPQIGDLTLHTHLKMEGSWRIVRAGERWPGPAHEARVVLTTERVQAVGLRLGLVELVRTIEEEQVVGHLGPDLLGRWDTADETEAVRRLMSSPERVLGETLLDQTVVAGIGTIWLAESCFVAGAHPLGSVRQLRDPAGFLRRVRRMMQTAVQVGRPVTTGDRRDPFWTYGRQHRQCRRCRTTIASGTVGLPPRQRTTYWCPSCQPL